jgi:hypothetical protein
MSPNTEVRRDQSRPQTQYPQGNAATIVNSEPVLRTLSPWHYSSTPQNSNACSCTQQRAKRPLNPTTQA